MSDTPTTRRDAGTEVPPPYRSGPVAPVTGRPKRTRIHHLRELKERGERWPMLTAYDMYAAEIFDEAGIPVLLVGDSAANNVYGYDNTLPVTVDGCCAGQGGRPGDAERAVRGDLPFALPDQPRAGARHLLRF